MTLDLEKELKRILARQERKANRMLKDLKPWEVWNEFAHSNQRLYPWS